MRERERADEIARALTMAGHGVSRTTDSMEGLILVEDEMPDLVILDWAMPHITGAIFLGAVVAGLKEPPPVLVLAEEDTDLVAIQKAGASLCLDRQVELATICAHAQTLAHRRAGQ
jgi:two-component system phosphate regulon response regulator PhoB